MGDATMWRGVLTETYLENNLIVEDKKIGTAFPDPNTAWREAEEFLEQHKKREVSIVSISLVPARYWEEKLEGIIRKNAPKTLN